MNTFCRLCEQDKILVESHIIPKFIFDYVKKTSVTRRIRFLNNINVPVQDGIKQPWLCAECEAMLSKWENYFAKKIFFPLLEHANRVFYNDNFLKFCVSLSWRVLQFLLEKHADEKFPEQIKTEIKSALSKWREFIFSQCTNPGKYEIHFDNFVGAIFGNKNELAPNIHRYLQRSIDINLIHNSTISLVYIKLPNFLITGYINLESPSKWRKTRVSVKNGELMPMNCQIPLELWEWINKKAFELNKGQKAISNKQREKISAIYKNRLDNVSASETFKAMDKDVKLHGVEDVFKNQK